MTCKLLKSRPGTCSDYMLKKHFNFEESFEVRQFPLKLANNKNCFLFYSMLYTKKLPLKFSSKCIYPTYFFYWFECFHRVCPNLSSAPCIYCISTYHCPPSPIFAAPSMTLYKMFMYWSYLENFPY